MRKALLFGGGTEFAEAYSGLFSRSGLVLERCRSAKSVRLEPSVRPVLVVHTGLGAAQVRVLEAVMAADHKLPVILITSGGKDASPLAKKLKARARHVLPGDFLKKDLQSAVKASVEHLELTGRLAEMESELARKERELSCVLGVTKVLSSSLEPSRILSNIMEHARSIVGGRSWLLFLVDALSGELVFNSAKGMSVSKARSFRLGPNEGACGQAALKLSPVVINDVGSAKGLDTVVERAVGVKPRSLMAVPITGNGRLLGVVEIINADGPEGFTSKDVELATMLMDQTAIAIERREMYQKMEDLAITDDLTKLFNLRYLDRSLDVEIERATRYNAPLSLIFMDVDRFKDVNDHYGHLIGSKLLVEISQILLQGLRKVDIVARYGGDEFVIVLPQTGVEAARQIAERLRRAIERAVFMRSENLALSLTASFGIASYPDHAATQEELMRLADEAMYRVKYQTRNDVYVAGE